MKGFLFISVTTLVCLFSHQTSNATTILPSSIVEPQHINLMHDLLRGMLRNQFDFNDNSVNQAPEEEHKLKVHLSLEQAMKMQGLMAILESQPTDCPKKNAQIKQIMKMLTQHINIDVEGNSEDVTKFVKSLLHKGTCSCNQSNESIPETTNSTVPEAMINSAQAYPETKIITLTKVEPPSEEKQPEESEKKDSPAQQEAQTEMLQKILNVLYGNMIHNSNQESADQNDSNGSISSAESSNEPNESESKSLPVINAIQLPDEQNNSNENQIPYIPPQAMRILIANAN